MKTYSVQFFDKDGWLGGVNFGSNEITLSEIAKVCPRIKCYRKPTGVVVLRWNQDDWEDVEDNIPLSLFIDKCVC